MQPSAASLTSRYRLMKGRGWRYWGLLWWWLGLGAPGALATPVHYELEVRLELAQSAIEIDAAVTLPPTTRLGAAHFDLGRQFALDAVTDARGRTLPFRKADSAAGGAPTRYLVEPPSAPPQASAASIHTVRLRYSGRFAGSDATLESPMMPKAFVGPRGAYLDGRSAWYPRFDDGLLTFVMSVQTPRGWEAISQGRRVRTVIADNSKVTWEETHPQPEIYLLAGRFHRYARITGTTEAAVYLRQPEPALATRYLDATEDYLGLYSQLLRPYPYAKFAAVENLWETGYGMPSFTLLGRRVIRFPFILHSSYPHEILHNWWGNGVYVDPSDGNWCEGLTAYLADHLLRERAGTDAAYRRATLQKYASYVARERDFAIKEFRARHDQASQAIGYGKTLMVFHMLRRRLGDTIFLAALRTFYDDNHFRYANFDDLRRAFERAGGGDLEHFFTQWVKRKGAPALAVRAVDLKRDASGGYRVTGSLRQLQDEAPYALSVPLALTVAENPKTIGFEVELTDREQPFELRSDAAPLRLDVDPAFDVFRRLDPQELPPSLGQAFGTKQATFVLPRDDGTEAYAAWRDLATAWSRYYETADVLEEEDTIELPRDRGVWILGWNNRLRNLVTGALPAIHTSAQPTTLLLNAHGREFRLAASEHSVALVASRAAEALTPPRVWVASDHPAAIRGLARKLPHYGKYSYVVFEGPQPNNLLKGQWPVRQSPLTVQLTSKTAARGSLPAGDALGTAAIQVR